MLSSYRTFRSTTTSLTEVTENTKATAGLLTPHSASSMDVPLTAHVITMITQKHPKTITLCSRPWFGRQHLLRIRPASRADQLKSKAGRARGGESLFAEQVETTDFRLT